MENTPNTNMQPQYGVNPQQQKYTPQGYTNGQNPVVNPQQPVVNPQQFSTNPNRRETNQMPPRAYGYANVPPAYKAQYTTPPQTPVQNSPIQPQYQGTLNAYTPPVQTPPAGVAYVQNNAQAQSPAAIYNNTPSNGAPQYHYSDPRYNVKFDNAYAQEQRRKKQETRNLYSDIIRMGNISGGILLLFLAVTFAASIVLVSMPFFNLYETNLSVSMFINIIYTLVVVGGMFSLLTLLYKIDKKRKPIGSTSPVNFKIKFCAPNNPLKTLLLVIISFAGCMLANYITSFFTGILSLFGIMPTYTSIENPTSIPDIILMCIAVAVIPPLIEELSIRGFVLTSLRKYGNALAIFGSALMFGLFHCDITQIPFAFICGLFFAYSVIATESLWTGVIVHALNNILSCIASILIQRAGEEAGNTFFTIISLGGILLGIGCLFVYLKLYKKEGILKYKGVASSLSNNQIIRKFVLSPTMIVAIIIYISVAALTTLDFAGFLDNII